VSGSFVFGSRPRCGRRANGSARARPSPPPPARLRAEPFLKTGGPGHQLTSHLPQPQPQQHHNKHQTKTKQTSNKNKHNRSYTNTTAVVSRISYIDGDRGVLRYRGYPIEELVAGGASFLEVAYLVLYGDLPAR